MLSAGVAALLNSGTIERLRPRPAPGLTEIRPMLEAFPFPVAMRDASGHERFANALHAAWVSENRDEIHSEAATRRNQIEDASALHGQLVESELFCAGASTMEGRYYLVRKQCIHVDDEPLVLVTVTDLTAERQARARLQSVLAQQLELLQHTNHFVQRLIDVIPEPVYVKDERGRYVMINEAFARQRSQNPDDILWRTAKDLAPDNRVARSVSDEDLSVLAGASVYKEDVSPHPITGEPRYRIVTKGSCMNAEGQKVIIGANFDITQRRLFEQALEAKLEQEKTQHRRTQEFVQRIMDLVPFPLYVKDAQSRYQMVNEAMVRNRAIPREQLLGRTGMPEESGAEALYRLFEEDGAVLAGQHVLREENGIHDYTGREYWHVLSKDCCLDPEGNQVIVGAHIDLTELRKAEAELKSSLEREVQLRERTQEFVQRLIDVIPDPMYIKKGAGSYVMVNQAFADYHARDKHQIVLAAGPLSNPRSATNILSRQEDDEVLAGKEVYKEEHTIRRATGEEVFRIVTKRRSVYVDGESVVVGIDHHITRWRQAERELQRLAAEDVLTGIANRRHFRQETERALSLAARHAQPLSLLIFDLDHFKHVNDHYGHQAGDEVLVETVRRCRETLRQSDVPGRWGGEEFVVLLPQTGIRDALQVSERLRILLAANPVATSAGAVPVTLSGGVAQWHAGESLDELIARADAALYRAKTGGRNAIFSAEADVQTHAA
ncbi:MAG: diguanylate cyclase [Rhodocyclaceae bacterium]